MLKSRGMALSAGLLLTLLACLVIIAVVVLPKPTSTLTLTLTSTTATHPVLKSLWVTLPNANSAGAAIFNEKSSAPDHWINKSALGSDVLDGMALNAATQGALQSAPHLLLKGDILPPAPAAQHLDTFSSAPSLCPADAYRRSSATNGM